jgi:branched-chain amino acid transport system ATP-binding protein
VRTWDVRPLLDVKGLNVFYGEARALRGVDLRVEDGEIASVVGPNGAGKSTLVKAVAGLLTDRTGEILLDGVDLMRPAGHEICDYGIAIVPEGRRIFAGMSVRDNLVLGGYRRGARAQREERLARVHELFPILAARAEQRAGTLSGGEQQMLALGRALMSGPRLLLLDEPSLGLAPVVVDTLFDALQEIHATGVTILLVEQNVSRALAISQRAHLLSDGSILKSGGAAELLVDPDVQRICLGV